MNDPLTHILRSKGSHLLVTNSSIKDVWQGSKDPPESFYESKLPKKFSPKLQNERPLQFSTGEYVTYSSQFSSFPLDCLIYEILRSVFFFAFWFFHYKTVGMNVLQAFFNRFYQNT